MKQMKPLQKLFVAFLVIITLASIVAEFMDTHGGSHGEEHTAVQPTHDEHESHDTHAEAAGSHSEHFWSGFKTFWIWFGAVGCAAITLFAKRVLGPVIYKKEDYYNE